VHVSGPVGRCAASSVGPHRVRRVARKVWTEEALVAGIRDGDRRALARAITLVENRDPASESILRQLFPETGSAILIGVTGPPGGGKSSLIGSMVRHVRDLGKTVGVISVDPSSPFTTGALLGDRIRLSDHFLDPGVYIRSMGTRGHLGGVSEATLQTALLLDAAGRDVIFIETVGTGQSEVEVIGIADVILLVLIPGSGDSVQALKAGIMEIPDVIAVNKMDSPAAKTMVSDVRSVIALDPDPSRRPQVLLTEAVRAVGVAELWEALQKRLGDLDADGRLDARRRNNLAGEVLAVASARLRERIEEVAAGQDELRDLIVAVQDRRVDPLTAVDRLIESVTLSYAKADPR
jgi:LAO/AO transport system kinase